MNTQTKIEEQVMEFVEELPEENFCETEQINHDLITEDEEEQIHEKNALSDIVLKFRKAKEFLDFYSNLKIKENLNPVIEDFHWDLACYYSDIRCVNKGGSNSTKNVVKGRQVGMTSFNAAYASWLASKGKKVLYIGSNSRMSEMFIEKCDKISRVAGTKDRYKGGLRQWTTSYCSKPNKVKLSFLNGGEILGTSSRKLKEEGYREAMDLIILDEFAFFSNAKDVWHSVLPLATMDGKILIYSTPSDYSSNKFFNLICRRCGWYHLPSTKAYWLKGEWLNMMKSTLRNKDYLREVLAKFVS